MAINDGVALTLPSRQRIYPTVVNGTGPPVLEVEPLPGNAV